MDGRVESLGHGIPWPADMPLPTPVRFEVTTDGSLFRAGDVVESTGVRGSSVLLDCREWAKTFCVPESAAPTAPTVWAVRVDVNGDYLFVRDDKPCRFHSDCDGYCVAVHCGHLKALCAIGSALLGRELRL